jgi:hypothetical protein
MLSHAKTLLTANDGRTLASLKVAPHHTFAVSLWPKGESLWRIGRDSLGIAYLDAGRLCLAILPDAEPETDAK